MSEIVIGYNIKEDKFAEPSAVICGVSVSSFSTPDSKAGQFIKGSYCFDKLSEAGVLDLWFDPVYKQSIEVKKGRWYKKVWDDMDIDLFYVMEVGKRGNFTWGQNFFRNGERLEVSTSGGSETLNDPRAEISEASEYEAKEVLIKEAKRRGYKKGNFICPLERYDEFNSNFSNWAYNKRASKLYTESRGEGGSIIWESGTWAELKVSMDLPELKGYQGVDNGKTITYGCTSTKKKHLKALIKMGVTSFKIRVDGSSVEIGEVELSAIKRYLNFNN